MPWGRIHTQDSPKYRKTKPKMKGVEIVEIFMTQLGDLFAQHMELSVRLVANTVTGKLYAALAQE